MKAELFRRLDAGMQPETILASNTSSISITKLAAVTRVRAGHRDALLQPGAGDAAGGDHPGAGDVARRRLDGEGFAERLGKVPVEVNDSTGFVSNRVLMPLINEACYAVMEGVATAEAVDAIFREGMAHPMGPLTLADLIGLDVCVDIMRVMAEGLGSARYSPCPLLVRMVDAGWLGRKSGKGFYTLWFAVVGGLPVVVTVSILRNLI